MNPFLLPGPAFLVFFALLGATVFAAVWWVQRAVADSGFGNAGQEPAPRLADPYEIALLRSGSKEAVQVALVALASRGAAHIANGQVMIGVAPLEDAHPFERAIAQEIGGGATVPSIVKSPTIANRLGQITESLAAKGLLLNAEQRALSIAALVAGAAALVVTAGVKLSIALSTGHTNVLFLVVLAAAVVLSLAFFLRPRRTRLGDTVLAACREEWLEVTSESQTSHAYLAMSSAILGLGIVPAALQPFVAGIQTAPASGGAACGGGSGCGGDGGGGGCGGGCGGCGGCGG